ncbi:hypothetical protein GCM10011344_32720 [Dokdonia pacifica]|nr:hypothetical protein GCM10011344_32720 [Dokdonia pacifica]
MYAWVLDNPSKGFKKATNNLNSFKMKNDQNKEVKEKSSNKNKLISRKEGFSRLSHEETVIKNNSVRFK